MKQARPKYLNDAVRHAVELEAYNRAERRKAEGQGYLCSTNTTDTRGESSSDNMEKLTNTLKLIQEDLRTLKAHTPESRGFRTPGQPRDTRGCGPQIQQRSFSKPQSPPRRQRSLRECYQCGSTEHLIRDCDQNPKKTGGQKYTEDQPKVSEKDCNNNVKVSGTNN